MTTQKERARALAVAAERVAALNELRTDDFQDEVVRVIDDARELWRGANGDLPSAGSDPLFDALIALADESEGSPEEVRDAVARARHVA